MFNPIFGPQHSRHSDADADGIDVVTNATPYYTTSQPTAPPRCTQKPQTQSHNCKYDDWLRMRCERLFIVLLCIYSINQSIKFI